MALSLNHLHFKTADPKKTAQWYVDHVGAKIGDLGRQLIERGRSARELPLHRNRSPLQLAQPGPIHRGAQDREGTAHLADLHARERTASPPL